MTRRLGPVRSSGGRTVVRALMIALMIAPVVAVLPAVTSTSATSSSVTSSSLTSSSAPGAASRRTTTTLETVPGIPQGAGRTAPPDADGSLPTTGTTLPPGPVRLRLTAVAVANQPVGIVSRPADATLYVIEKAGRIRALRDGRLEPAPVLDISARVSSTNENGLLGLAFPTGADAPAQQVMYVLYNDLRRTITLSEIPFDGLQADPSRERVLISLAKRTDEHNAGTLVSTTDGFLWVAVGDGGPAGDPQNNAQRLDRLFGKVLRIDPRTPSNGLPYAIPQDNPYARRSTSLTGGVARNARAEIWASGLRNPWGLSVDEVTGDVWIPDVGETAFEEINRVPRARAGANLGWRLREGRALFTGGRPRGATDPVHDYPHRDGRCAVVGGALYRGAAMPSLQGAYVFGDVCSGRIAALVPSGSGTGWTAVSLGARLSYLTSFGVDRSGELYATSLEGGIVSVSSAG